MILSRRNFIYSALAALGSRALPVPVSWSSPPEVVITDMVYGPIDLAASYTSGWVDFNLDSIYLPKPIVTHLVVSVQEITSPPISA